VSEVVGGGDAPIALEQRQLALDRVDEPRRAACAYVRAWLGLGLGLGLMVRVRVRVKG